MATKNDVGAVALPSSTELSLDRTILAHDRWPLYLTPRNPGVDRGHSSAITLLLPACIYVRCHMSYGIWHVAYETWR
jgi:hypothetical protein